MTITHRTQHGFLLVGLIEYPAEEKSQIRSYHHQILQLFLKPFQGNAAGFISEAGGARASHANKHVEQEGSK